MIHTHTSLLKRLFVGIASVSLLVGGSLLGGCNDAQAGALLGAGIGALAGQVEVYKVNHHGSSYSSNEEFLRTIKPKVGIISTGDGNNYGHPTDGCLERLHAEGIKTYWTEEGAGAQPEPDLDIVAGHIVVTVQPNADNFTVSYSGNTTASAVT